MAMRVRRRRVAALPKLSVSAGRSPHGAERNARPPSPSNQLPFEPLEPNVETIEAVKAARRGELVTGGSTDELLASLNADD